MKKLKTLDDLFAHQLKDIYSAETQISETLPQLVKNTRNKELKKAFTNHLGETKGQIARLDNIGEELGISLRGETCKAMKGLISEAKSFISEDAEPHVRDAGIIADVQRIEHYEISAYGTVVEYAKALGKKGIAKTLDKTLKEESKADETLNKLAIGTINAKATA